MFKLWVSQARYGDSLILEYGEDAQPRYVLIDGGPKGVFEDHLRHTLKQIARPTAQLSLVVLSHVDEDHVAGLIDLFEELLWQRMHGQAAKVSIDELWHNSFSEALGEDLAERLGRVLDRAGAGRSLLRRSDRTSRDIAQGDELTQYSEKLTVRRNPRFGPDGIISLDRSSEPIDLGGLSLRIVGPTAEGLADLRTAWQAWLQAQEKQAPPDDLRSYEKVARGLDTSIPNLSSIMLLAEAHGKRILLTGDGRSDDLEEGLQQAGLLDQSGRMHVDVLKLPHHGSKYNVTRDFLNRITADVYVVSASGYHGHPHQETLDWVVTAAHDQGRAIKILATNSTKTTRDLVQKRDPREYGYRLTVMPKSKHAVVLPLAP